MKVSIRAIARFVFVGIATSAYVAVAAEPEVAEPAKPEVPQITHRNLHQIKELVEQGADPNAHYFLYDGLP